MRTDLPWGDYTRLTEDRAGRKIGTKIQDRHNREKAKELGVRLEYHFDDTNLSAADPEKERPDYEEALRLLEDGMIGGLIVYRVDRLTRLSEQWGRVTRVIRRHRTTIVESIPGGSSTDSLHGMQSLRRAVGEAENEVESTRVRVTANKSERSRRGLYHGGGRRPFGFQGAKKAKDGRVKNSGKVGVKHVPHEVELLREAARRRLDGESYTDIIRDWHAREPPVYGATGAPWNLKTLETILTAPRMVGKTVYRKTSESGEVVEKLRPAKWKAVLDEDTWEKLRGLRTFREHGPTAEYMLSGIAKCGRCGHHLTGARRNYLKGGEMVGVLTYRCRSGLNDKARGACGRLSVLAADVEGLIVARILRRIERTHGMVGEVGEDSEPQSELARLNVEVEDCQRELEAFAAMADDPDYMMSATEVLAFRRPYLARIQKAKERRSEILRQLSFPSPDTEAMQDLVGWFGQLRMGQKRQLVTGYFREIVVLPPGRSGRYFRPERLVATPTGPEDSDGLGG